MHVLIDRDTFVNWATDAHREWTAANPGRRPSVDRRDPAGHYAVGNLRILEWGENAKLSRRNKNVHAPADKAWCSSCRRYKDRTEFHRSEGTHNGLTNKCKGCVRAYQQKYYARKKRKNAR